MSTAPAPRSRRRLTAVAAVIAVLALSGCGLRLQTPDPAEPTPDAAEELRATAVTDAQTIADGADQVAESADPAVASILTLVHDAATEHLTQLGGVYDSGLTPATPTPSPTISAATLSDPTELLGLLASTAIRARSQALSAEDSSMARLLAVIAAARAQEATLLAEALGAETPALTDEDSADQSTSTADPSASAAGLDATTVSDLTAAEDQAGYGYEVAAARLSDDARTTATADASTHRERAEDWAQSAGISGTAQDPRRVAYDLGEAPSGTEAVRTFCAGLESGLTEVYADAVLASQAGSTDRALLVDRLREAAVAVLGWGGTGTALPGMDTLAGTADPTSSAP